MPSLIPVFLPLLVSLVLSQPTSRNVEQPRPKINWIDCVDQIPLTLNTTGIDLENLPSTLHCGQITVPMDYSKPISEQNNITLGLAMYRPENPKGVVFFNPGGSDEATIFAWETALNTSTEFAGLTDYDLMMMDTRGTYHSNPTNVSLTLDGFLTILGRYPTTPDEFDAAKKASAEVLQSWAELSSPPGILEFIGTREAVQDLESIRIALCYNKINFIGASYGGYRAAQYATTYPERVGNFALDSLGPHGISLVDQAKNEIDAANRALLRADAYCQNSDTCPFRANGTGSVPQIYKQLVQTAAVTPLYASLCVNSTACISPVDASNIQTGMQNALQGDPDFPGIFGALLEAQAGDASKFAMVANIPITNIQYVWAVPIICADTYIGNNTFEAFQSSVEAGLKGDAYLLGKSQAWQTQLLCSAWPYPVPNSDSVPLPKPMVLVSADFDASAPTEWTRVTWERNPDSALVIRHGDDHVSIQLDTPSSSITKEFIRTGVLPDSRNETLVSVYRTGMEVAPIANPYDVPTGVVAGDVDSD